MKMIVNNANRYGNLPGPPSTDINLLRTNPFFMTLSTFSTDVITNTHSTPQNAEARANVPRLASFSRVTPNIADANFIPNPMPSACSKKNESSSDSSGRSLLSWTQSQRIFEYIQSKKFNELLQQKQETPEEALLQYTHHSSMQLYQQLQRLYQEKRTLLPVNGQSYSRGISRESNESILSHDTTSTQWSHCGSSQESNDYMSSPLPMPFCPKLHVRCGTKRRCQISR